MERGTQLFLSLWGKLNVLKMDCILMLNYVLQSLQIGIARMYLKRFNHICRGFLWNGKCPMIKLEKLQVPTSQGGMYLPKLVLYHCLLPETYSSVDIAT